MKHPLTIALALLIIGGLSMWLAHKSETQQQTPRYTEGPREVDYYLRGLKVTTMDKLGQPARTLQAKLVKHFPDDNTTELQTPRLLVYQQETPPWQIDAEHGWVSADGELILLNGNVHIERKPVPGVKPVKIDTRNLRVQPTQDYAETDEVVKVRSYPDRLDARGMQAWFREPSRIKFLADVKGYYAPPQ